MGISRGEMIVRNPYLLCDIIDKLKINTIRELFNMLHVSTHFRHPEVISTLFKKSEIPSCEYDLLFHTLLNPQLFTIDHDYINGESVKKNILLSNMKYMVKPIYTKPLGNLGTYLDRYETRYINIPVLDGPYGPYSFTQTFRWRVLRLCPRPYPLPHPYLSHPSPIPSQRITVIENDRLQQKNIYKSWRHKKITENRNMFISKNSKRKRISKNLLIRKTK